MKPRSIRFRITAVAMVAVAVVLLVAGIAIVLFQGRALTSSIDQTLVARADAIATLVGSGSLPSELPGGAGEERFTQVVGPGGEVIGATANLAALAALDLPTDPTGNDRISTVVVAAVDDDGFRVLSRRITPGVTVYTGATSDTVDEAIGALIQGLVVTIPIVTMTLGLLVWWLVGRTLQPVERIRFEVETISSTDLDRRVPEPGTGDEIARLAETMNQMLARLETAANRQRRFVADASHELRSPLTRLRAEIEVELLQTEDDGWRRQLEGLLDEVVGMQEVAEDLLYLARLDEEPPVAATRRVDLDDVVIDEANRLHAGDRVVVDTSAVSGAQVVGHPGQLSRAVRNLLDNAERHATARVTVGLVESGPDAILTVTDDGPGVPAEDTERIFERFGRLDEARTRDTGGSGLGLAIARDIAHRHGGSLRVVDMEAPGATFEMSLPRAD